MRLPLGRRWLFFPAVAVGIVLLAASVRNRRDPQPEVIAPVVRTLRVVVVPQTTLVPRIVGYGTAQPGSIWTAVSEVKGRVVEVNRELKAGSILHQGDVALRIDPAEYQLLVAQLEADIAEVESQLTQLAAEEDNYRASLKIEESSLKLAERDLQRLETANQTNSVTDLDVERKAREVLTQRQSVQAITNSLNTLPARAGALEAGLAARRAALSTAQLDLEHTTIFVPMDCRLGEVEIEVGQYVAAGQSLFEAHGTDVTEVEAQFAIERARVLLGDNKRVFDTSGDVMKNLREMFAIEAKVRLKRGDFVVEWPARFARIREQLNPQTRSVQIVVAVDKPYENVVPGRRPPLSAGMFCEVELTGAPRPDQLLVPRTAVDVGHVYVVDDENRLVRRDVEIAFYQGELGVVQSGLAAGERVIVSDPTPAIERMLVDPVVDEQLTDEMLAEAAGRGDRS